jgi:hypothetical protein
MPLLQPGLRMVQERGPLIPLLTEIVATDDILRPQMTSRFNRYWTEKPFDFPKMYSMPETRVWTKDPVTTRGDLQNILFGKRYQVAPPPTRISPQVVGMSIRNDSK